ncbi:MAG: chromosome partitioning protein ParB, partial [Sphingomonadales bacterium]
MEDDVMTESKPAKTKGLGRGLSALLGEDAEDYASLDKVRATKDVPVELLRPNRYQPRIHFDEVKLDELV